MYKKTLLKNGLRIITIPSSKDTQTTTILILVGAGSKYENERESGISHFIEHMFFKGTKKRPNVLKIAETLDKVGGAYNAFTGKEYTGYWAKVNYKHSDLALDWVTDIFLNSKIEEKDIQKERGVVTQEINMYLDTPTSYIWQLWEKLLYGNQPAGRPVLGKPENIQRFKRKDFIDYLNSHYSLENTIICISGRIKQGSIEKRIEKYFKNNKRKQIKTKLKVKEKQVRPQVLVNFKETDQTHICLGVRGYNIFDSQQYAQSILAGMLGGMMSSRLFVSMRGKGLVYYVKTISQTYTDSGYLTTLAGINSKKLKNAIKLILREYASFKQKEISKTELQKAKDFLKGKMSLSLESSDAKASFFAAQEILTNKILTQKQVCNQIDKVTTKDVLNLAKHIFRPEKLNLSLIGPFKNKTDFEKLLKI